MRLTNILGNRCAATALFAASSPPRRPSINTPRKKTGFRDFIVNLKQSLMAYAFNIFGIVAGTVVAYFLGIFQMFPWAFIAYPPILSARGVIGGLFCGRLSTGLHLGTIRPSFLKNTRSFYLLFNAIVVLTFEASVLMGLVAATLFAWSRGCLNIDFLNILIVVVSTMAMSIVVISPLAMTTAFLSFKHGLDPDIVLYPVESTIADLLITFLYVMTLNVFAFSDSTGKCLLILVSLTLLFYTTYSIIRNFREEEFVETLKEAFLTIVLVSFIINVAGSTFGEIAEKVKERREIYTVYPALIDTIGDVGSIVGSTLTTKLALGVLKPSFSSIRNHHLEILGAWMASIIMYCIYSALSLTIQGAFALNSFLRFTALLLLTNLIAASLIVVVSYEVAILTYKKGFDPDNFEIPIESSLADSITSIALLIALLLLG